MRKAEMNISNEFRSLLKDGLKHHSFIVENLDDEDAIIESFGSSLVRELHEAEQTGDSSTSPATRFWKEQLTGQIPGLDLGGLFMLDNEKVADAISWSTNRPGDEGAVIADQLFFHRMTAEYLVTLTFTDGEGTLLLERVLSDDEIKSDVAQAEVKLLLLRINQIDDSEINIDDDIEDEEDIFSDVIESTQKYYPIVINQPVSLKDIFKHPQERAWINAWLDGQLKEWKLWVAVSRPTRFVSKHIVIPEARPKHEESQERPVIKRGRMSLPARVMQDENGVAVHLRRTDPSQVTIKVETPLNLDLDEIRLDADETDNLPSIRLVNRVATSVGSIDIELRTEDDSPES